VPDRLTLAAPFLPASYIPSPRLRRSCHETSLPRMTPATSRPIWCSMCLRNDRDKLLAFYDFPAEHWKHQRTTNPIESTFATVCHRTIRSKGCLSNKTALAMVFKLIEGAQNNWRRFDGHNQLPKLVLGVTFNNGIEVIAKPTDRQPKKTAA
jgi:hypothetical protein